MFSLKVCLRKTAYASLSNTHLRKMLTRRLCPKQNSLHNFSTVPFLYKRNHLQKNVAQLGICSSVHRFAKSTFVWRMPLATSAWLPTV